MISLVVFVFADVRVVAEQAEGVAVLIPPFFISERAVLFGSTSECPLLVAPFASSSTLPKNRDFVAKKKLRGKEVWLEKQSYVDPHPSVPP